ncbi:Integral membrane protein TerC [Candidatus Rhodobacter oscarellae]|uniref:Integral membrane protein TerC n=1 Tax=Candidatus Rhodobacter oscarellae TaxID=1675527 RepID=A0A0J9E8U5_9RHOB|nr:TerC family protein [Candidatus Rhodobacter lobularis]KMW59202.1 Integral membrane protein TerC [Candidatus Rhodobacter lobularis]
MIDTAMDFGKIIIADLILSGDNALVIGMAAAGLSPELRRKAIIYGMVIAAVLRIVFAVIATTLLGIPGILFVGALLLIWVCWRLFVEIREGAGAEAEHAMATAGDPAGGYTGAPQRTMLSALISITIADVSMSLDNVLAVAAIADGDRVMLVFGLGLAIVLMAFCATIIMKLLTHYPWISWLGLVVLVYVAGEMLFRGFFDINHGIGPMLGLVEGMHLGKGGH